VHTQVVLLGKELADMGLTLIYGGSSLGMMGLLAITVKEHCGKAIGIITKSLIEKEKPLDILDELHIEMRSCLIVLMDAHDFPVIRMSIPPSNRFIV
jgi:predicted Rossmann-fold nucleotide-binding protein